MSLLHSWRRLPQGARRDRQTPRIRNRRRFTVEGVEDRTLLSTILWTNRGSSGSDTDNFNATYGVNASTARAIVDEALEAWEDVIVDFNYAGGGNTFSVDVSASNLGGTSRGEATNITVDASGKPTGADIGLDDNGGGPGWFFDTSPDDHGEFNNLVTRFTASFAGAANDFYRTITHELGHALGIALGSGLAINNFLTARGTDQVDGSQLFRFSAGTTQATITANGGGHLYEGPADPAFPGDPVHPNDLLNPGRTIGAPPTTRQLITDTDARLLRDAYGYTINLPSTRQTFLATFNSVTDTLTVNRDPNFANQTVTLDTSSVLGTPVITVDVDGVTSTWLGPGSVVVQAGAGNDTINVMGTMAGIPTTINGNGGNDTVNIGDAGSVANVKGNVTVNGGTGADTVNVIDTADTAGSITTLTSTTVSRSGVGTISYAVENLNLTGGDGNDSFNVTSSNPGTAVRISGSDGTDTLNVDDSASAADNTYTLTSTSVSRPGAATISYLVEDLHLTGGSGDDTFNVTSSNPSTAVGITGSGGTDTLSIDDSAGAADNTYTLTSTSVSRPGASTISYAVEDLILSGGSGSDIFNVTSTNPATAVSLFGNGGTDTLNIDDTASTADNTYTLTSTSVSRPGAATISYFVEDLHLSGGGGDDVFNVTSSDPGTAVSLFGNDGTDTLNIDDTTSTAGNIYTLTSTSVSRPGAATISYFVEDLHLSGGGGDDVFNVQSTDPATAVSLFGNGGTDTLNIDDSASTADNTYTLTSTSVSRPGAATISYSVEHLNLSGGGGDDTFRFQQGSAVSGTIFGGAGSDTLDYSGFTSAVTVDLAAGEATGTVGITGVENALGGSAGDTLTGDGSANILVGNGGDDSISGGDGRDVLIGGANTDKLTGGNDDDVVIGSATVFDADIAALRAIVVEWKRPDANYATRIGHLKGRIAGGLNKSTLLNTSKIVDDFIGDSLMGGAGLDWFFAFVPPDVIIDKDPLEVVN